MGRVRLNMNTPRPRGNAPAGVSRMKIGDMDYEQVLQLFRALNARGVEYIVIGAVALGLHGIVRATQDVDLFVRPTAENVARLRQALFDLWNDPAVAGIEDKEFGGEIAALTYGPPTGEVTVDLIARLGEAYRFEDIEWQEVEAGDGVTVHVATREMLLRMKRGTVRPQDAADAYAIEQRLQAENE